MTQITSNGAGIDFASEATALIVESTAQAISYRELGRRVDAFREKVSDGRGPELAFQFTPNSLGGVVAYLACLGAKIPLGFGEPAAAVRARVIATYRPTLLFLPLDDGVAPAGYLRVDSTEPEIAIWRRSEGFGGALHPDLALLLATSGSTGDVKFVRLSRANLFSNAISIAEYLGLGAAEVAPLSLPIHYSYGLSVLNSHLVSGATVVVTRHSFMRPEFWSGVAGCGGTSFAGVPYMYETMQRLRINPAAFRIRTLTQAGGHLRIESVKHFHSLAKARNGRFFVMYGQTEATARMSYVPPERLEEKLGTIGVAIPRGEFWLQRMEGDASTHQLYYRGPNVMLGYANGPEDLARGDEQNGVLATGDLAESDGSGFYRITGRLARFAKLYGKRINLAGVESEAERIAGTRAATLDGGDHLQLFLEKGTDAQIEQTRLALAEWLGVPPPALRLATIGELPMTASGKKDYKALKR